MRIDRKRWTGIKISKEKTKKIGVRSISDIINNTTNLTFKEKVDYIRHHYTYYNGNYMFFHTADGKPNSKKYKLNYLISQILRGQKDPSELKKFNSLILKWHKEYKKQRNQLKNNLLEKVSLPKDENISWRQYYQNSFYKDNLIESYLQANKDIIKPEILEKISYKDLKHIATKWNNVKQYNTEFQINSLDDFIEKISKKTTLETKPYLSLILMYLKEHGSEYDLDTLRIKKYKDFKEIAIKWAAYKKAHNNFNDSELPELVKETINKKAENISKQEEQWAIAHMKKWVVDYNTREESNAAA